MAASLAWHSFLPPAETFGRQAFTKPTLSSRYLYTKVLCHTSDNMAKVFWIWKNRLTEVVTAISDMADVEFTLSSLDRIKYGLVGTSEEKDNWFDYGIGKIIVRLAVDNDDNDIVHFQITDFDQKSINRLSDIGTKE